jgi:hypothetical protein
MHVTGSPGHERLMAGKNYLGMPPPRSPSQTAAAVARLEKVIKRRDLILPVARLIGSMQSWIARSSATIPGPAGLFKSQKAHLPGQVRRDSGADE